MEIMKRKGGPWREGNVCTAQTDRGSGLRTCERFLPRDARKANDPDYKRAKCGEGRFSGGDTPMGVTGVGGRSTLLALGETPGESTAGHHAHPPARLGLNQTKPNRTKNETEQKTKQNEMKQNKTKQNEMKQKRNKTKQNERK